MSYTSVVSSAGTRCLSPGKRFDGRIFMSVCQWLAWLRVFLSRRRLNLDHLELDLDTTASVFVLCCGWMELQKRTQSVALSPGKVDINIASVYYKENQLLFQQHFFYNAAQRKSNEKCIELAAGLHFHSLAGAFCDKFMNVARYLLPFGRFGVRRYLLSFWKRKSEINILISKRPQKLFIFSF